MINMYNVMCWTELNAGCERNLSHSVVKSKIQFYFISGHVVFSSRQISHANIDMGKVILVVVWICEVAMTLHCILSSAVDEVATLEPHTINPDTAANFCTLCLNITSSFGVGGCRTEFYTDENLKKCGIPVSDSSKSGSNS
jgi:hypothetical protein